jgi:phosphoribosylanthranilate isomerase
MIVKVKICHFTHPQDVDLALALGADFLGFHCFNPQGPNKLSKLFELIPKSSLSKNVLLTDFTLPFIYNDLK